MATRIPTDVSEMEVSDGEPASGTPSDPPTIAIALPHRDRDRSIMNLYGDVQSHRRSCISMEQIDER